MPRPIVIAHHLIWTVYGTWLPNDPRGSGSRAIACDVLRDLGDVHYGRKRVQPSDAVIRAFYAQATPLLKHEVRMIDAAVVAHAFEQTIEQRRYTCYACAIMPDHVHLLIRKHRDTAETMIEALKSDSVAACIAAGTHPPGHPVWVGGLGWKVFLEHPDEVQRTIRYIEANPTKARMSAQRWPFVQSYDRWPLHPGHSLNSPYVKALRAAGRYP